MVRNCKLVLLCFSVAIFNGSNVIKPLTCYGCEKSDLRFDLIIPALGYWTVPSSTTDIIFNKNKIEIMQQL